MLIKKIPKRSMIVFPSEIGSVLSFLRTHPLNASSFIKMFEDRFKEYVGAKEVIAVSSGRCALSLILRNLGLCERDKIIVSAYNFAGVPKQLIREGYCPVFVDADESTYQIDINKIEEKIDSQTKAIIVTHLFGQPCDLGRILYIANKHNLFVIEDAAHSLGSYFSDKHTASFGDAGFFSLTGTKPLNTSFGGIVVTNNLNLALKIRAELSGYNFPKRKELIKQRLITYIFALVTNRIFYSLIVWPISVLMVNFNLDFLEIYKKAKKSEIAEDKMRFTGFQAAIALGQMTFLHNFIEKRKKMAKILVSNLDSHISIQKFPPESDPNYFMVAIRAKDKHRLFKKLLLKGIDTNLHYDTDCSYLTGDVFTPIARRLSKEILTINLPFDLTERETLYLSRILNANKDWLY